jgi:hypothetical protein
MFRAEKILYTLLLALAAAFGTVAQEQPAQPADPFAPAPEAVEPAPEIPDVAWVRLAHFSPNANELTVELAPTSEDVAFTADAFDPIAYQTFTEYMEVPAGNYVVTATGSEDVGALEEEFSFARGNYYTLAAIGMVLPPEAQAEAEEDGEEEEGAFVGFFRNLFGGNGDADRDRLALQFSLFQDDLTRAPEEGESLVRLVHAAPGTEPGDLAVMGEQGTLIDGVAFGNASRYEGFEGSMSELEVRLAGSRAATLVLDQLNLESGNLNTVYLVGTPVEQAPVEVLGSSIAPVEAGAAAGEDVAAGVAGDGEAAGGGAGEEDAEDAEDGAADDAADGAEEPATDETEETDGEDGADTGDGAETEEAPATEEEGAETEETDGQ